MRWKIPMLLSTERICSMPEHRRKFSPQFKAEAVQMVISTGSRSRRSPGIRLVGDITYLKTGEGWLYLATVIDLATRMVTGWQLASHMRTSLVTDALAMAISHGHIQPGAVFHSDYAEAGVKPRNPGLPCSGRAS